MLPPPPANTETGVFSFVDEWADRVGTTPRALILAGVAALTVVGGAWLYWWNSAPPSPEVTIPFAALVAEPGAVEYQPPIIDPDPLLVHVAGAVVNPGVYSLDTNKRVGDAIAAAGGPIAEADINRLNLAAPLIDGSRIYVPALGEEAGPSLLEPSGSATSGPAIVNINTADQNSLETLPGVGPSTAAAIIAHRERHGAFRSVDDLIDVRGIGEAKLAALRDRVTV